jgi:hypothetical protein
MASHQLVQRRRWYDLLVIMNDAISEIYYAQLVEQESRARSRLSSKRASDFPCTLNLVLL